MEISKATLGALLGVCLMGGVGGAYLITRDAPEPAPVAATAPDPAAAAAVEESEALVGDSVAQAPAATTPQAPAATPASAAPPAVKDSARSARTSTPARDARPTAARPAPPVSTPDPHPVEPARDTRASAVPVAETAAAAPVEPAAPPPPPAPTFEELVVSADSVIGLQMESSVTSERARVEDQVVAQVTRDVKVGDRVAIPSGAKAYGEVTLVDRGGRMRERARLGVRFTSIVLADGTHVPIETDTIIREGSPPTGESSAKIGGGALGGAIIGGILGGAKGAIIGGSAGAGAGTAAVLAGGRNAATLPSGTPVTVRLEKPATVTVDK